MEEDTKTTEYFFINNVVNDEYNIELLMNNNLVDYEMLKFILNLLCYAQV